MTRLLSRSSCQKFCEIILSAPWQWTRDSLFSNGEWGEIGLVWSVWSIFRTPIAESWLFGPPDFSVQRRAVACIACHASWLACMACHASICTLPDQRADTFGTQASNFKFRLKFTTPSECEKFSGGLRAREASRITGKDYLEQNLGL